MDSRLERVDQEPLNDLTLMISPSVPGIELIPWARHHRQAIDGLLLETPAILFRGFEDAGALILSEFSSVFADPIDYIYRSTPRTELSTGVYTATEYPSEFEIPQHCENAYQQVWPLKIFFYCQQNARKGGETPLGDVRKVTASIPESIKKKFVDHGVMYVRNYTPGMDIPWQTVFQTTDRSGVEKYCNDNAIEFEWVGPDSLKTTQVCQAVARHPTTHEELWFNQAHLFHVSSLEASVRDYLLSTYSEQGLPRNAFYGNGDPIGDEDLTQIRTAFEAHKRQFSWQDGDTLLIDNMLCSHGRNPFEGPRKVLVSMTTPSR